MIDYLNFKFGIITVHKYWVVKQMNYPKLADS